MKEFEGIGSYQGEDREICRFYFYMSPKDLVVKFFEDGYTNQNYDFIMKRVADAYIDHSPAGARSNADAVEILKIVANQFSDLKVRVLDVFAEDEMVATRVLYDAVHTGECMGIAPTSKRINFEALENFRIENGKIKNDVKKYLDKPVEQDLIDKICKYYVKGCKLLIQGTTKCAICHVKHLSIHSSHTPSLFL